MRALLGVLLLILAPMPALAQEAPGDLAYGRCEPGQALWAFGYQPAGAEPVGRPAHTDTYVWSCKVGGRLLVVRHQFEDYLWMCSAAPGGTVSAWLDGHRLVTRREVGDRAECFHGDDFDVLRSISMAKTGAPVICRDRTGRKICAEVQPEAAPDPAYHAPAQRTPPGLAVRYGPAFLCGPLVGRLAQADGLAGMAIPPDPGWQGGSIHEDRLFARVDIDNDGAVDELWLGEVMKLRGPEAGRARWRSGTRMFAAREPPRTTREVAALPEKDIYFGFDVTPVRLGGRNYLYMARRPIRETRFDSEAVFGARPDGDTQITRGLIELRPDGSSTLACGWGPVLRPEEFL